MIANSSTTTLKIIIDADSCPVKDIVFKVAKQTLTPVLVVASIAHQMNEIGPGVTVVTVDNVPQAADMEIINRARAHDIVVTGDYGLAALVLGKGAAALSPRGFVYSQENIDMLLERRHMEAKVRRSGGKTRGPKAFTIDDKRKFELKLTEMIAND